MNLVICWSNISGYMSACWKALQAARPDIRLSVIAISGNKPGGQIAFDDSLMSGLDYQLIDELSEKNATAIETFVVDRKPDIVVIPGWFSPQYTRLTQQPALANTKFVMTMDTPYRGTLRQRLGKFKIASLLKRVDGVVVAGERAFQLARVLNVPEQKIMRGVYGYDDAPLEPIFNTRTGRFSDPLSDTRKFLFVARYVEDKAIDILVDGYARYRSSVTNPWPLTCCGQGPLQHLIKGDGITDRGFVQPIDLPGILLDHDAYVLCSRYEPWGVALAEAMASGLPAIVTEAVGASVELVRSQFNGLIVPTNEAESLARAFLWMHEHPEMLPTMGQNARATAAAFAAPVWARRWGALLDQIS